MALTYREITGLWSARVPDGPDSDQYPDTVLLEGHVTFEPEYRPPLVYPGEHIVIEPMHAVIHEGVLYGETVVGDDVVRGPLFLPVTVDEDANQSWAWVARFQGMRLGEYGEEVSLPAMRFQVPAGDDALDLSAVIPASQSGGTITLRGPAGASVVGGRDNGDGTVSFELSDGTETDPVTVPPGPAGRGIESVTGDGASATIEFTDGTTTTVPLPAGEDGHSPVLAWDGSRLTVDGIPGPDLTGPEGPAPSVEWSGAHLVVGGVEGPDLTGPSGPTPSVSWSGPHLVVGGVSGPDLTGPQGVPGTVPTAADYMVVGPGRPDAPTTTGMTAAALNALPVGAEYRSTDGASVGAWVWRKRPAGWVVTEGDTGPLNITALLEASGTWDVGAEPSHISRVGDFVYVSLSSMRASNTTHAKQMSWPPGFAKAAAGPAFSPFIQQTGGSGEGSVSGFVNAHGTGLYLKATSTAVHVMAEVAPFRTTAPWPTTLTL